MIIGVLSLKENQLFFKSIGKDRTEEGTIKLEPGDTFEIGLASIWIPVQLGAEYGASDEIRWFRFVTPDGSFCGFVPGMIVRLSQKEQRMSDEALEWDDREELSGTENEHFTRPSHEIIEYARSNNIHMNLWSRMVQKILLLRIQRGLTTTGNNVHEIDE